MKNIKKLLSTTLSLILVTGLVGCSSKAPTDVVENYFEGIKNGNTEIVETLLSENTEQLEEGQELSDELNEKLVSTIKKITYTVNSEKIDGDNATVNVKVNGPDIAQVIASCMEEAFSKVFAQAFSGEELTKEEEDAMYNDILLNALEEVKYTDRTEDIKLIKENGEWKIDDEKALSKLLLNIDPSLFGEKSEDETNNTPIETMTINEPFNVKTENGDYILTIEGARETDKRNEFSEKEVTKVVILDYTYQNLSFGEELGEDLYIDEYSFQVLDDEGNVLDTYPVYDDNRLPKNTPVGAKCKSSATFAVTTDSKNLNVTFVRDYNKKVANIIVPIN